MPTINEILAGGLSGAGRLFGDYAERAIDARFAAPSPPVAVSPQTGATYTEGQPAPLIDKRTLLIGGAIFAAVLLVVVLRK